MAEFVQSVDRALDILELLSNFQQGLNIKDISEKLDLHKSTVHRLLGTLIYKGYVEQHKDSNKYYVTLKLFQLGSRKIENIDLIDISKPYLIQLAKTSEEVVHLVMRDDADIIYVDKVEGNQTIRMHSRIGNRSPMYCTGVGKAILSTLSREEIKDVWDKSQIQKLTDKTIVTLDHMYKTIDTIQERGYALDDEENEIGVRCIAVPILDFKGDSYAAISISGPANRMTEEKINLYSKELIRSSKEISAQLGYKR